jgi:hypothetical protein
VDNIQAGFRKTGIYPLDPSTLNGRMGPSSAYKDEEGEDEGPKIPSHEGSDLLQQVSIQEVLLEDEDLASSKDHYVVNIGDSEGDLEQELELPLSQEPDDCQEQGRISGLLSLPTMPISRCRASSTQPLVDYSRSILLTCDEYLKHVETLAARHSEAAKVRDAQKLASEERKRKREEDRIVQVQKKKDRDEGKAQKAREKAYWADVASRGWGNELQARMKSTAPPPPGSYRGVYVGTVPAWCIANQRRRHLMLDLRRQEASSAARRLAGSTRMREHDMSVCMPLEQVKRCSKDLLGLGVRHDEQ